MQLYIFPPSPNSLRVQAVANQLGIDLELIPIDLPKGQQMDEEFVKLNPNHKIPILVDGDFVLCESSAIMSYLASKKPDSELVPIDIKQRAMVEQWQFWNTAQFSPACGVYTYETLVKKILELGDPDQDEIAKADENFHRYATVLNDHLADRDSLAGDSITIADHAVGSNLIHAEPAGIPVEHYNNILRWWGAIVSTEAWQKALAVIGNN